MPTVIVFFLLILPQGNRATHVDYGKSECAYCRMIIDKKQFGGEFEAKSGKVFIFDAIECLAASYYRDWNVPSRDVKSIRFVNYSKPGTLMDASAATLVRTSSVLTPMGVNIIALPSRAAALKMKKALDDAIISWKECVELVKGYWHLPPPKPQ